MAFVAVMFVPVVRIGVSDPGRVRARSVRVVRSGGCVVLSAKRSNDGIKPERPGDAESNGFVPRGPTMRQLYEESGRLPRTVTDKSEGALPQVVADRMFKRMMILFGAPFLLGLSTFIGLFVLNYRYEIAFQPSVVGFTTLGTFGIALMGLTYGIMSASWDPDEPGSFLGIEEAKKNLIRVVDGLRTQRAREIREENQVTKDRRE